MLASVVDILIITARLKCEREEIVRQKKYMSKQVDFKSDSNIDLNRESLGNS